MMKREKAVELINGFAGNSTLCIYSNGQIGRESYVHIDRKGNFYVLSSMGKPTAIGLGVALARPDKEVFVVEGDGNALMGLDSFAMVGYSKPKNFTHIVLDNKEHATTGGQESQSSRIDLSEMARSAGYKKVQTVKTYEELESALKNRKGSDKPHFILALIEKGNADVSRKARHAPEMIRDRFMEATSS